MKRFRPPVMASILGLVVCFAVRDVEAEDIFDSNPTTDLAARESVGAPFDEATALQTTLTRAERRIGSYFDAAGVTYPPAALTFVALKQEARMEVWADDGRGWAFIRSYLITTTSGRLGPKLRHGDHQVPEGIYRVTGFNPQSRFYLSMRLDYPNDFDRGRASADGRYGLGGDIMIHGGHASDGCLPVGDSAIEELYAVASRVGSGRVAVVVSPMDLRRNSVAQALARVSGPPWLDRLYGSIAAKLADFPIRAGSVEPPLAGQTLTVGRAKCGAYDAADCDRRCAKGDAASCARAGLMYRDGRGVTADKNKAWSLLTKACASGDALGCSELSVLFVDDEGTRRDAGRASELAEAACDSGEGHGCKYLSDLCIDRSIYRAGADACSQELIRHLRERAVAAFAYDCKGWGAYDCDTLADIYAATNPDTALRYASGACKGGDNVGCDELARLSAAGQNIAQATEPGRQEPPRVAGVFNARQLASRP